MSPGLTGRELTALDGNGDFLDAFVAAAERFADRVGAVDLQVPVKACPGWTNYDLVVHLANTHSWAASIVETGREAVELNDEPVSRKPRLVSAWYAARAEDLYQVLRAADPEAECWNFAADAGVPARADFWPRRQLHETVMHGVDLGLEEIPPMVAADGVAEVLTVFVPRMHLRGYRADLTASLSLVASDLVDRAWTLVPRKQAFTDARPKGLDALVPEQARSPVARPDPNGPPFLVERVHPRADKVEAPAAVLVQALWKRLPADDPRLRVTGDRGRVDAFFASRIVP